MVYYVSLPSSYFIHAVFKSHTVSNKYKHLYYLQKIKAALFTHYNPIKIFLISKN